MRLRLLVLALCFVAPLALTAKSQTSAETILSQAEMQAAQQHKSVFVLFHASWCGWCRRFETYLDSPDVRPIIEKYFVVARINAMEQMGKHPELNSPGGEKLLKQFGGAGAMPFIALLDSEGRLVVNSNAPTSGNIGFPAEPGEIDWFMKMMAKAVPSMTSHEAQTLETSLHGPKTLPAGKSEQ